MIYHEGFVYAADCAANRVYRIDLKGRLTVIAGNGTRGFSGDGGKAQDASLNCPMSIAPSRRGGILIADSR